MYVNIEIAVPYSLKEVFSSEVHNRLSELRQSALECISDRKAAWNYLSSPRYGWGERSLFEQSLSSPEGHDKAMTAIAQMKYRAYA